MVMKVLFDLAHKREVVSVVLFSTAVSLLFDPSRNLGSDIDIQNFSELLYVILSEEFGDKSIIQIRRAMSMLAEKVVNQLSSDDNYLLQQLLPVDILAFHKF
jgi:hypothetical protein